jgi:hypothetical protein
MAKADAVYIRIFAVLSILRWYFLALNVRGAEKNFERHSSSVFPFRGELRTLGNQGSAEQ